MTERYEVLKDLIITHGWTRGAEIGVMYGATLFYLLKHCPQLYMFGVDPWEVSGNTWPSNLETGDTFYGAKEMLLCWSTVVTTAKQFGSRVIILKMRSADAAQKIADGYLDFVWIDGDHHTAAVIEDIAAWRPKLRPGGWLIGHDADWPSVQRAIDQVIPGWQSYPDCIWAYPVFETNSAKEN